MLYNNREETLGTGTSGERIDFHYQNLRSSIFIFSNFRSHFALTIIITICKLVANIVDIVTNAINPCTHLRNNIESKYLHCGLVLNS